MYFFLLSLLDNFQLRLGIDRFWEEYMIENYCICRAAFLFNQLIFVNLFSVGYLVRFYWFAYLRGPVLLLFIDILAGASSLKYWTFYM